VRVWHYQTKLGPTPLDTIICMTWQEKLIEFILACQDSETGGFTDRPGDWVSVSKEQGGM